jgi:DNA-binding MarR family transcriptional regulator
LLASKQLLIEMPIPAITLDEKTVTRLRIALARLSRRLRNTEATAAAGLSPTRISVLLAIVREERIGISALAEAEGLNPTMLSRTISSLVGDGLVARISDDGDRRAAWVQSTGAGRKLAERMRHERTEALNRALAELPEKDRAVLEQALPALEGLAEQLRGERS